MSSYNGYIFLVLGSTSMVSGFAVLIYYIISKNWKEPPAMLVFWHILSHSCIDTTISATGISLVILGQSLERYCYIVGVFNLYFYVLAFNYIVCLCIEVLLKLHRPMENSYNKRAKAYHLISHAISWIFAICMNFLDQVGETDYGFCFIKEDTSYIFILAIPLLIFLPVLVATYFVAFKMKITTQYVSFFVKKHLLYITVYFLIWFPIIVDLWLERSASRYKEACFTLLSLSGFIMTLLRVLGVIYIRYLNRTTRSSTNNISIAAMINETLKQNPDMPLLNVEYGKQSDYVYVFNCISTESALTAIIIFNYSLQFSSSPPLEDKMPPWDARFYSERQEIKIDQSKLDQMLLPKSLKSYCNPSIVSSLSLEYTQYSNLIFRSLMEIEEITAQDLMNSFNLMSILTDFSSIFRNSGGRSSSFFLYSTDKKYIIKTISGKELKVLLSDFLKAYHSHLYKFHDSIICRIIGAYSFQVNMNYTVNFIVMQSVYNETHLKALYDLKGSKVDRKVKSNEGENEKQDLIVFKDINFLLQEKKMVMPVAVAQRMKEIIENDVKLFPRFNIMDYSLMVAVKQQPEFSKFFFRGLNMQVGYSIGIIDFLQRYNKTKKIEGFSKKILSQSTQISSINSEDYCKRFLNFIDMIVEGVK